MKRILIVEDDDAIRTGLCRSLFSDTLDTVGVKNLMSARQRLNAERYNLLLLDCNLPDGNGIDFCRKLMKRAPMPVIFLTVCDSEEETWDRRVTESYRNLAALVSDIAHQCKTPLTAAAMYAEMLAPSVEAEAIGEQTGKLQFLLDALVKLSQCEGGLIEENVHPVIESVETLTAQALSAVVPAAEKKNIVFSVEIPQGLTTLFDLRWTAEAMETILDNGVKYAPENSKIMVAA